MKNKDDQLLSTMEQLIQRQGQGKSLTELPLARNPQLVALLSKLVKPRPGDPEPTQDFESSQSFSMVLSNLEAISRRTAVRMEDAENTFKLFPDLGLCEAIVVASVCSPKDMQQTELNYKLLDSRFTPAQISRIVDLMRKTSTEVYGFEKRLQSIVANMTFRGGSNPILVLPEAAVDHLINNTEVMATESIQTLIKNSDLFYDEKATSLRPLGFLGAPNIERGATKRVSAMESFAMAGSMAPSEKLNTKVAHGLRDLDELVHPEKIAEWMSDYTLISDNPHILKFPQVIETVRARQSAAITGSKVRIAAIESGAISPNRLYSTLYKNSNSSYKPIVAIPSASSLKRRSIGRPLVLHVSPCAVATVYSPGDHTRQLGAFILADYDGYIVSNETYEMDDSSLTSQMNVGTMDRNAGLASLLTEKARKNITTDNYLPFLDKIGSVHAELLERDILERASRGLLGGTELKIGQLEELSKIMIARRLKGSYTRVIYVPAEYLSYMAINYHRNGVGKSYLDDLSHLTSMRAMSLIARIWSKVRSSIAVTKTNITFDKNCTDPQKTISAVKHLLAQTRQIEFPTGLKSFQDMTSWIHTAGQLITWDNHPRLPNTKIDTEATRLDHVEPDESLDELLRHMQYMFIGLSPETVDSAAKTEFATTIQNQSVLFGRRINMIQDTTEEGLTDANKKIFYADEVFQRELLEIFNSSPDEFEALLTDEEKETWKTDKAKVTLSLMAEAIESLRVCLPRANSTAIKNQAQELKDYEDFVDASIKYVIDQNILPANISGPLSEEISALKEVWKAELMRNFMAVNNILPEMFEIAQTDNEGKPLVDVKGSVENYSRNLMLSTLSYLQGMKKWRVAAEQDITKILGDEAGQSDVTSTDDSSSDGGGDYSDPFGESDMGGTDPFAEPAEGGEAGGEEMPTGETPEGGSEETPENPPEPEAPEA